MATWPAGVRPYPDARSWVEVPQDNVVSFQPETGPSIDRRRGTAAGDVYQGSFSRLTQAQKNIVRAWYRDELKHGTLPFTWTDPLTGEAVEWKFHREGGNPIQFTAIHNDNHTMAVRLLRLP